MAWLLKSFGVFLRSVFWWWVRTVGGEVVAFFQIWYAIKYQQWPPAMSWVVLGICLFVACFLAWREQYLKANELAGKPLTGVRLRKECDKWIKSGQDLFNQLTDKQAQSKALNEVSRWLEDFDRFAEVNLSVSDYDAVTRSESRSERYFEELANLEPATRLQNYQRMVGHRFGWLSVFRNKIK
jgi:hypothetical protein